MEEIAFGASVITPDNLLNLESIDPELILVILQNLSIPDIQNFCISTKRHRNLCRSSAFKMILQPKIEEFKPALLEMSYQELMETCRTYPILQGFCEDDDAFWDTKFRSDFEGEIEELLETQGDFYLERAGKSINQLLNKEAYEEFMQWDNFMLFEEDRPDIITGHLVLGRYLRRDLPEYVAISMDRIGEEFSAEDYRNIVNYIVYELGVPVPPEVTEALQRYEGVN